MREVILIAAVGPDLLIGDEDRLPWRLPRDMRMFRRLTLGQLVVMGRKTFESLQSRPLPRRRNVVVSRNMNFVAPGCEVAHSLRDAIERAPADGRVFIIGGGSIYSQAMPLATAVLLTEIFDENPNSNLFSPFRGDVYFPAIDSREWQEVTKSRRPYIAASRIAGHQAMKRTGLKFRVRRLVRRGFDVAVAARLKAQEIQSSLTVARTPDVADHTESQGSLFHDGD